MNEYEKLLLQNKSWSEEMRQHDPKFFDRLAEQQKPKFLWIGCSDSRVPANEITGTQPGEIFVQRNIANLVIPTDLNLLSVLQYAVEVLQVEHIIVCGHYGCGGVQAAMGHKNLGLINKWLHRIKEVYQANIKELESISDEKQRQDRMVELNVMAQCRELTKTSIVQKAWKTRKAPVIHGWVYGLNDGLLKDLITNDPASDKIDPIFQFDLE